MDNTNHTGENAITLSEELKRPENQASSLDHIVGSGFQSRQNHGLTDEEQSEPTLSAVEQVTPDAQPVPITDVSGTLALSAEGTSTDSQAGNGMGDTSTQTLDTSRECTNSKPDKKTASGEIPKGRRKLPLRIIKNNLRQLDYEQTKAIRDWADNRLLTTLRPDTPVSDDSKSKPSQPS